MPNMSERIAKALQEQNQVVNGEEVTGEGFGKFLVDYVIYGGNITTNATTVTISETLLCFKDDLYEIGETILPVPHNMISKTLFVDFMPDTGFSLAAAHPSLPYFPMYQAVTDASGNVVSFSDQRGATGELRFKPEYATAVFPSLEIAINDAEAAATAANTAAAGVNDAITDADTAAAAANAAALSVDTALDNVDTATASANTAAAAANTAKTNADTAASSANTAATSADAAKTNADTAATSANSAATAANTAKTNADTAAASATTAAGAANTAKTNADTAATSANTAAGAANTAKTNADNAATSATTAAGTANAAATAANTATTNADTATASANTAAAAANTAKTNADTAATSANTAAVNANDAATTTRLNYLVPVTNYADIDTTYPTPAVGDVVQVTTDNKQYRWDGSTWLFINDFNSTGGEYVANKGVPGGYAGLDGTGKVPAEQLPPMNTPHASTHITGGNDVIPNAVASGNAGLMSGADKARLDGAEQVGNKGAANGYAGLDADSKVPSTQLPVASASVLGGVKQGVNTTIDAAGMVMVAAPYATYWNGKQDALGYTPENVTKKGASNGYAGLDAGSKVPATQLPVATATALGGVIQGSNVTIDAAGIVSVAAPYVHPANHPASIITQDASNRFVADTEKTTWNGKLDSSAYTAADVLAKIKTVDGVGSGLDTDVVRGKEVVARDGSVTMTGALLVDLIASLGTAINNTLDLQSLKGNSGNGNLLVTRLVRDVAGVDWTGVSVELVKRVDATDHQRVRFEPDGDINLLPYSTGVVRAAGSKVWTDGNDGAGSGLDADLLDGLNSSAFLQLAGGTMSGQLVAATTVGGIGVASGNHKLEVKAGGGTGDAAYMAFHRPGYYASFFGLDTDNKWKVGGWSAGAVANELWHAGNTPKITVSTSAPISPALNDVWIQK